MVGEELFPEKDDEKDGFVSNSLWMEKNQVVARRELFIKYFVM